MAAKPPVGVGLIPPPPPATILSDTKANETNPPTHDIAIQISNSTKNPLPAENHKAIITNSGTSNMANVALGANASCSSANLMSSDACVATINPSPQPSPSCLRPYRKLEDVTTVKRHPKTGWL